MPLNKSKSIVSNKHWRGNSKRFFVMCKTAGLDGESTKEYYENLLGVHHLKDFSESQWEYIFEELEREIQEKAEEDGVLFAKDLEKAMNAVLN